MDDLVSIIILSFNTLKNTKICIESIKRHTTFPYELILVEQNSNDGSREYVKGLGCKNIFLNKNVGFAKGCNLGAKISSGNFLLFLNSDTIIVDPKWLEKMINGMYLNKADAINPRGNAAGLAKKLKEGDGDKETSFLSGFCLLIKKNIFEAVGRWDEKFIIGLSEDTDLCLKLHKMDFKMVVLSNVYIEHTGSVSFKANNIDTMGEVKKRNLKYLNQKWNTNYK
jgi:GT2 family glycosyltransferase